MAASSLPYSFFSIKARRSYLKGCNIRPGLKVIKVQSYQDEGRSTNNMVDANLDVLKKRIEVVKVKERLERCCKCQNGWNYYPIPNGNDYHKIKRREEFQSLVELATLVCGTLGFTCFGGTLFLCLVSMLVHLQL